MPDKSFEVQGIELPSERYTKQISSELGMHLSPLSEQEKPDYLKERDVYRLDGTDVTIAFYPMLNEDRATYLSFEVPYDPRILKIREGASLDRYRISQNTIGGTLGKINPEKGKIEDLNLKSLVDIIDIYTNPNLI